MSVAGGIQGRARAVTFDVQDNVFLVFGPAGVFDGDQKPAGIEVHGHLSWGRGAAYAQIAQGSFRAGECLFADDGVPFAALPEKGVSQAAPNDDGTRDRGGAVLLVFVALLFFGESCREVFLRSLLGAFIPHGPVSRPPVYTKREATPGGVPKSEYHDFKLQRHGSSRCEGLGSTNRGRPASTRAAKARTKSTGLKTRHYKRRRLTGGGKQNTLQHQCARGCRLHEKPAAAGGHRRDDEDRKSVV